MGSRFIVGLDVGTSSVKVVLAERTRDGRPALKLAFKEPAGGIRKGIIVDVADASQSVANALGEVKKVARQALGTVYVGVGTHRMKTRPSHGVVQVSRVDTEIYQDDVDRVVRMSQAVSLEHNRMIVHSVTREFVVEGVDDIPDPVGLSGNRLEVLGLIVDGFAPDVKNVTRVTELCGGQVAGLVLSPLAASRAALSRAQRDLGVVLIDIGAGTTGVVVYGENKLLGTTVIPFGAANVTNDIAVGVKIPVDAAENLKVGYGYAFARDVNAKETVELKQVAPDERGSISRRLLAEIIEARLAEIFGFVNNELKALRKADQFPGGAVLVGGGAKLPGITELVRQDLKLSSEIGVPIPEEWARDGGEYDECFEDPEFVTAFGLALWGVDHEGWRPEKVRRGSIVKQFLRYFQP